MAQISSIFNLFPYIITVCSLALILSMDRLELWHRRISERYSHIHLLLRLGITLGFIGNSYALAGAFLHLIGHVFMKSGLFFQFSCNRIQIRKLPSFRVSAGFIRRCLLHQLLSFGLTFDDQDTANCRFRQMVHCAEELYRIIQFVYLAVLV